MSRYNRPVRSEQTPSGKTFEGAPGYKRDPASELYLLAVSYMGGDDNFYETSDQRAARLAALTRIVAVSDPEWIAAFIPFLRTEAFMRTASIVVAAEAAKAMVEKGIPGSRKIVDAACQRADEPGEFLAYWIPRYGEGGKAKLPMPVKRGLADACVRMWGEFQILKYDTESHRIRYGDVLALTHAGGKDASRRLKGPWQGDAFGWAVGRRYGRSPDEQRGIDAMNLTMVRANRNIRLLAGDHPGVLLDSSNLRKAGMTWEDVLSLAGQHNISKTQVWEAMIPVMGYMALLRNLRNFDQAGISAESRDLVAARLTDPEQVAKSMQLPMRFLSAYRHAGDEWKPALEEALRLSLRNIPELPGSSLILVDRSGSMIGASVAKPGSRGSNYGSWRRETTSGESEPLDRADTAALFGSALALRSGGRDTLVQFGSTSAAVPYGPDDSVLAMVSHKFTSMGGTMTADAVRKWYRGQSRVIILTDEQAHWSGRYGEPAREVPEEVPVYTWNLAGYEHGHGPDTPTRWTFGGLTDVHFRLISMLERGAASLTAA